MKKYIRLVSVGFANPAGADKADIWHLTHFTHQLL